MISSLLAKCIWSMVFWKNVRGFMAKVRFAVGPFFVGEVRWFNYFSKNIL